MIHFHAVLVAEFFVYYLFSCNSFERAEEVNKISASCELRVTSYELLFKKIKVRVASCELHDKKIKVASCELQNAL